MTAWLASYPLLKNNQPAVNQLLQCSQRVMPPVSLGCSSCYNERGCGVTSGPVFVGGTGP